MTAHSDRTIRILVVDDHRPVRQGRRGFRNGEPGLELVGAAADGRRATNLDRYQFIPEDQKPDQPALIEGVGSAARAVAWAAARKRLECAVRPCHHGAAGLRLRVVGARDPSVAGEVDAGAILEAANAAVTSARRPVLFRGLLTPPPMSEPSARGLRVSA
jgi:hypothetical protein